ncbi:MAG: hypothetical protein ABL891_19275 [Burkholderiales bacterium]
MISKDTQQLIDNMSREELLSEIMRENRSRFQNDNYSYLKTRLAVIDEQQRSCAHEKEVNFSAEANRIAAEANDIARNSLATAGKAFRMSALAVMVAVVSAVLALLSQCTKG